jgi:hypothetical protein
VRGADLESRVGVGGVLSEPLLGKRQCALNAAAELPIEIGRRRLSLDRGACLAQVVLDRDRALLKERVDPERCRDQAMRRRVFGIELTRGAECGKRVLVIQVVSGFEAARLQPRRL